MSSQDYRRAHYFHAIICLIQPQMLICQGNNSDFELDLEYELNSYSGLKRCATNQKTSLLAKSSEATVHMADEHTAAKDASAIAANGGSCEQTIDCRALADSSTDECPAKRPKLMDNNGCSAGPSMPILQTPTPSIASISRDLYLTYVICCPVLQLSPKFIHTFFRMVIILLDLNDWIRMFRIRTNWI